LRNRANGQSVWTEEDLEQFERRWPIGTRERVMFDVYLYTDLRRGDAAKLGKQHIRNNDANYLRQKLAALTKWEDYVIKIASQKAIAA
jgi:hypothetical protein